MTNPGTPEQFAAAVAATLDATRHIFDEVDRLNEAMFAGLLAEPTPFSFIGGSPLDPNKWTKYIDRRIRDQYHFLLEPGLGDAEDFEETDHDDEEEAGPSIAQRINLPVPKGPRVQIRSGRPYLAIGILLSDRVPRGLGNAGPHVRAMVLTDWKVGTPAKTPKKGTFEMSRYMVTRMLRSIPTSALGNGLLSDTTPSKEHVPSKESAERPWNQPNRFVSDENDPGFILTPPPAVTQDNASESAIPLPAQKLQNCTRLITRGKAHGFGGAASDAVVSVSFAAPPKIKPLIELTGIDVVDALVAEIKENWKIVTEQRPKSSNEASS